MAFWAVRWADVEGRMGRVGGAGRLRTQSVRWLLVWGLVGCSGGSSDLDAPPSGDTADSANITDTGAEDSGPTDTDADSEAVEDTDPGSVDTDPRTCGELEAEYARLVQTPACQDPSDCVVLGGYCGFSGLGGCYELAVVGGTTQEALAALNTAYGAAGCGYAFCDCYGPPLANCVEGYCAFETDSGL